MNEGWSLLPGSPQSSGSCHWGMPYPLMVRKVVWNLSSTSVSKSNVPSTFLHIHNGEEKKGFIFTRSHLVTELFLTMDVWNPFSPSQSSPMHAHLHPHLHTLTPHTQTYAHSYAHSLTRTHSHTCTLKHSHTHTYSHTLIPMHSHTQAHAHTHAHSHVHTHIHKCARTHRPFYGSRLYKDLER